MWLGDVVAGRWRRGTAVGVLAHVTAIVVVAVAAGLVWRQLFRGLTWWSWAALWLVMLVVNDVRTALRRRRMRDDPRGRPGYTDGRVDRDRRPGDDRGEPGRARW